MRNRHYLPKRHLPGFKLPDNGVWTSNQLETLCTECGIRFGQHKHGYPHISNEGCEGFQPPLDCIYPRRPTAEEMYEALSNE